MILVFVVLLALVDVAALSIGISIRRKVVRIIGDAAGEIEAAVKAGVDEALLRFGTLAADLFRALGRPEAAEKVLEELRS